jgi:hypothetical protein
MRSPRPAAKIIATLGKGIVIKTQASAGVLKQKWLEMPANRRFSTPQ